MTAPAGDPDWHGLDPRALVLRRLLAVLGIGLLTAVLAVGGALQRGVPGLLVVLGVGAAVLLLTLRVLRRQFEAWSWAQREDDLLLRRGVLVRRTTVVPYGRMQFVDVTAGPMDRRFGLARVVLHTAAVHTDSSIPGLATADADRLRDRLAALGEARAAGV